MTRMFWQGFEGKLRHWDVTFWAERLREARYQLTDEQLRPYFALPIVLDGLFQARPSWCCRCCKACIDLLSRSVNKYWHGPQTEVRSCGCCMRLTASDKHRTCFSDESTTHACAAV